MFRLSKIGCLLLLWLGAGQVVAQNPEPTNAMVSFEGKALSAEEKQALRDLLEPNSPLTIIARARENLRPAGQVFSYIQLCEIYRNLAETSPGNTDLLPKVCHQVTSGDIAPTPDSAGDLGFGIDYRARLLSVDDLNRRLEPVLSHTVTDPGFVEGPSAGDFLLMEDTHPLLHIVGDDTLCANASVAGASDGCQARRDGNAPTLWALPVPTALRQDTRAFTPGGADTCPDCALTTSWIRPSVIEQMIARVDRDLQRYGHSDLTVRFASNNAAMAFTSGVRDSVASAIQGITTHATSSVTQAIDKGFEFYSMNSGKCETSAATWPMPVDKIAETLSFNKRVMELSGVFLPRRTRVLVVDSGLGKDLKSHGEFSKFLFPRTRSGLRNDFEFVRPASLDQELTPNVFCTFEGPDGGRNPYGYVYPSGVNVASCDNKNIRASIHPYPLNPRDVDGPDYVVPDNYNPDHGSFVGVLNAGGPDLLSKVPFLYQHMVIGFARIMWLEQSGAGFSLTSDHTKISGAFQHATGDGYQVVNTSLKYVNSTGDASIKSANNFLESGGILVSAAGNTPGTPGETQTHFPYSLIASVEKPHQLIIVGGLQQVDGSGVEIWDDSTTHPRNVDILAPAASVNSLLSSGDRACMDGTSAAAPLVSFVAAMLYSYGYDPRREVKSRILATATPHLTEPLSLHARRGAVLDVRAALDVFVDQVWLKGRAAPLRGRIPSRVDRIASGFIPVCDDLIDFKLIDPNKIMLWHRVAPDELERWDVGKPNGQSRCKISAEKVDSLGLGFECLEGPCPETLLLRDVERIVPSQNRRALNLYFETLGN